MYPVTARGWRNRQTRTVQVRVPERAWGFNSPLAHNGLVAKPARSHLRNLPTGRLSCFWGTSRQRRHQFNETTATISGLQSRSCWLGSLTSANGITLADSVKGKESPSRYSSPPIFTP